jgi:hypothetical protein
MSSSLTLEAEQIGMEGQLAETCDGVRVVGTI